MLSFESAQKTPWHKVPVVLKFCAVCVATVFLFVFDAWYVQFAALIVCCLLYLVGGTQFLSTGVRRVRFLWPVLLIILFWHVMSGTKLQGLAIVLRLVTIVGLSNLMTMTSRLSDLLDLIHKALIPVRAMGIQTRALEIAIALVVRFTPVLITKGTALMDAWRTRAVKHPSWRIVFPLSLIAIDDAEHVAEALKARGGVNAFE